MIFTLCLFSPKHHQELSRKSNYWNKIIWAWLLHQHFISLQPFRFKYWLPNPQFFLPIPHLRPLSADPSPLITAKFISRDWQSLKGKGDWTQLSSLAVFLLISGGNGQLSVSLQPLAGIPADSCCVKKIMAVHPP